MKIKCYFLRWNSPHQFCEWLDGFIVGYRCGGVNEDFDRVDLIETNGGFYRGCHPDCVVKEV